jgi:hypothetical protein
MNWSHEIAVWKSTLQCCHLAYRWLRHRTSAFVLWPTLPTFAAQEVGSYLGTPDGLLT